MGNKPSKALDNEQNTQQEEQFQRNLQKQQRKRVVERENLLTNLVIEPLPTDYFTANEKQGELKIIVISDTHNKAGEMSHEIPPGDILIHCGDFTDFSTDEEIKQFQHFLQNQPHKYKLIIAGNHDKSFLTNNHPQIVQEFIKDCIYLNNETIEIESKKIYGIPWIKGDFTKTNEVYNNIPEDLDILITHAPPLGYGDCMIAPKHSGDQELLKAVLDKKPKIHLFGHAHEGSGIYKNDNTIFINAAICTRDLRPEKAPVIVIL